MVGTVDPKEQMESGSLRRQSSFNSSANPSRINERWLLKSMKKRADFVRSKMAGFRTRIIAGSRNMGRSFSGIAEMEWFSTAVITRLSTSSTFSTEFSLKVAGCCTAYWRLHDGVSENEQMKEFHSKFCLKIVAEYRPVHLLPMNSSNLFLAVGRVKPELAA